MEDFVDATGIVDSVQEAGVILAGVVAAAVVLFLAFKVVAVGFAYGRAALLVYGASKVARRALAASDRRR